MLTYTKLRSENIFAIAYDGELKYLRVFFHRGGIIQSCYDYRTVPPEMVQALLTASSPTNYLRSNIAKQFASATYRIKDAAFDVAVFDMKQALGIKEVG